MLAESTGKNGTGIAPIVGEPSVDAAEYGADRAFVVLSLASDRAASERVGELTRAGHPVIALDMSAEGDVGAQMFLWEFATAVAGAAMDINPFDQPDVEAAKVASRSALESGPGRAWPADDPDEVFGSLAPGDLAVLCAFAPRDEERARVLNAARSKLAREHGVATMAGFGPRYLHSTGQLHKGGPPRVNALVVLDEPAGDETIPGESYGFTDLVTAQAAGDADALAAAGRAVARTTWPVFEAWASG